MLQISHCTRPAAALLLLTCLLAGRGFGSIPQRPSDYDTADRVTSEQRNAFGLLGVVDVTREFAPGTDRLVSAGLAGGPLTTYTPDPEDLARVKTITAPGFSGSGARP
ncbi:MAG: hypothetical protein A3K19_04605 [Lentisphaerae bacterium RIFOXYB12_FULL_65_16]|nr:MAG: hypothetical protein A3K53_07145 [Deltaproteobacteria bacterium RIFOXYB2_FULL_66_7]OGV74064.1 MAG: hypothetical protein A3K18_01345 [Lentisphaerae bacterium RIFOXYA12_64_32]OGV84599.1 MAG: hypothetical protein A3K19_04605 [Lentisphaerae bacterium RIFOXYB12_FULL_65_16]